MKKVLVTGAAGVIGFYVVKYLLAEGKYEVTILDLKNNNVINKLKRFKKRCNIVYGDVTDRVLIEALVKDHDYIINLASSMSPLANMKKDLSLSIDYGGCENIIRAITYYNKDCHLFYASTTSLYKEHENATVRSKINLSEFDYFEEAKLKTEKLIKEKLSNYTIYRVPLVLSNGIDETFVYQGDKNSLMTVITPEDAANAFVKGIKNSSNLNKKTFNIGMNTPINYGDLLNKMLSINGLSFKYVFARVFLEKNYYSPVCSDLDDLNNIIKYQSDSIDDYYFRLKRRIKNRRVQKFLAKPFIRDDKK